MEGGERFESIQYGARRVRDSQQNRTNSREQRYKSRDLVAYSKPKFPSKIISQCLPVVPVVLSSRTRNEERIVLRRI